MTRIIAASIIQDAKRFVRPLIESLSWADTHVIVDDHSTDGTATLLKTLSGLFPRLCLYEPWFSGPMLPVVDGRRDLTREQEVRNRFLDLLYEHYNPDALVLIDADEVMPTSVRAVVERMLAVGTHDAIAFECNHLVNKKSRLRVHEQCWNGVTMVDPHVRILFERRSYQPGVWANVPDCFIEPTERTCCMAGPYHFHLKYLEWLSEPNLALTDLPLASQRTLDSGYTESLPTSLPLEIERVLDAYLPV